MEQGSTINHLVNELRRNAENSPDLANQVNQFLDTPIGVEKLGRRFAIISTIAYLGTMTKSQTPVTEEAYLDSFTASLSKDHPELKGTQRERELRDEQITFLKIAVENGYVIYQNDEYQLSELGRKTYSKMQDLE